MRILTWSPEHLDELFHKPQGKRVLVKLEHPNGQANTVTLVLGIECENQLNYSFRWFVQLKAINGNTQTDDQSTFQELSVKFKVKLYQEKKKPLYVDFFLKKCYYKYYVQYSTTLGISGDVSK